MTFKIVNKYLQENNRTFVAIRQESPYTAFDRVLIGDRTNDTDEALIQAVLGQVATEFNPADDKKLSDKDAKIAEAKAVADWAVLAAVTNTENPLDPTLYARGLELIDLAKEGKEYKPYDIFTIEDPAYSPKFGEGRRVLVQVNNSFTYNNESVKDLEGTLSQNGVLAVWKWTEPKQPQATGDLETQPVQ